MLRIFIFLLLSSCASTPNDTSHEAIVNLATTSYIRGCIDGKNDIYKIKTKGRRFDRCKELSRKHKIDLEQIFQTD